jgi:hypothetical protein
MILARATVPTRRVGSWVGRLVDRTDGYQTPMRCTVLKRYTVLKEDTMNLRNQISLPDLASVDTPDVGALADDLLDLAAVAADAFSSAAGNVPGLTDYRAAARRKRVLSIVGVIALVVIVAAIVKRRKQDDPST